MVDNGVHQDSCHLQSSDRRRAIIWAVMEYESQVPVIKGQLDRRQIVILYDLSDYRQIYLYTFIPQYLNNIEWQQRDTREHLT